MYNMYVHSTVCIFTDLPSPVDLRTSTICVTFFNISWNASNGITCGNISYEVSVFQSSIGQSVKEITRIGDVFYSSITGLNNSDPDVMVTVAASNRAGQGNMSIPVRLPPSLGKSYVWMCYSWAIYIDILIYLDYLILHVSCTNIDFCNWCSWNVITLICLAHVCQLMG